VGWCVLLIIGYYAKLYPRQVIDNYKPYIISDYFNLKRNCGGLVVFYCAGWWAPVGVSNTLNKYSNTRIKNNRGIRCRVELYQLFGVEVYQFRGTKPHF